MLKGYTTLQLHKIREYYRLAKPGIIKGNMLAFTGAFLFASGRTISITQLIIAAGGTALVIASGCTLNNILDISIDTKMKRTQKRALVTGRITPLSALIFSIVLGVAGSAVLAIFVNALTVILGLIALFSYVVIYGYVKRRSLYGTHVGTFPGAIPPVAGYVAVTGDFDAVALVLFLAMSVWQLPHFFAIAIFRRKEYESAKIPVMPSVKSIGTVKKQIVFFIALYILVIISFGFLRITSYTTLALMYLPAVYWLWIAISRYSLNSEAWARKVFGYSLIVLLTYSLALALNTWVP